MEVKIIGKDAIGKFIASLIHSEKVIGVKKQENKFAFGEIKDAGELVMDYDVTLRPPKIFFQPPCENILDFKIGKNTEIKARFEAEPFILFGVHSYDLKALNQMDKIWADGAADEHYLSKRRAATIIAMEPTRASKWSFWASMDAILADKGFDLLFTDIGDRYAVEIESKKGRALISKHAPDTKTATKEDIEVRNRVREKLSSLCNSDRAIKARPEEITPLVKNNYAHPIWEKQAEKCYSCGSCNLVCPTCYCFDVKDSIELDLKHGTRYRAWDGCLLEAFASVGSGENFREHRSDRFRHRILRKTVFVPEKIGALACVGCGRCSEACLPDITDPVKVINEIAGGE